MSPLKLSNVGILSVSAGLLLLLWTADVSAKPPVGKRWQSSQLVSMDRIDHGAFDALLKTYVDRDGYVDYAKWQASSKDRQALQGYLRDLGRANPNTRTTREGKLAFWINAYNAVTLEGMLQVYPTSSIRNHTAKVFGYNIWKELPLIVGSSTYSLEQMEHEILRKMSEPRIHFAIVCASVGCPRLRNEAYTSARLEKQLADNAKDFFSRSKNFRFDARRGTIQTSAILDWFEEDFGADQRKRLTYLKPYLPQSAQQLVANPRTRISYIDYDWSLNDQKTRPRSSSRRGKSRQ